MASPSQTQSLVTPAGETIVTTSMVREFMLLVRPHLVVLTHTNCPSIPPEDSPIWGELYAMTQGQPPVVVPILLNLALQSLAE